MPENEYKPYSLDDLKSAWEAEDKKKNLRNFVNHLFKDGSLAGYAPFYTLTHPWVIIRFLKNNIKWGWQRLFRGWDDRVIWSIDWYLTRHIPVWLKQLKEQKHGVPNEAFLPEDWDEKIGDYKPGKFEEAEARYNQVLDDIIAGFESHQKIEDESYWIKDPEYAPLQAKFENGLELFKKYYHTLWD